MKTRSSKNKISSDYLSPSPTLSHAITKKKRVFCDIKVIIEGPEVPEGPLRFLFRFHSDRFLFRFLSDRILLGVFSDNVLFESSAIGCSSGFSVIDSSLGSSVLFFRHAARFYQNVLLLFLLKTDVLFYIIFSKRSSHLTIISEKNEEILAWYRHRILYWKYMSSISRFINYLYCWMCSSYILHKKFNKLVQEPDWPFVSSWNLKSLSILFSLICFYSFYHSLSFPVTHCDSLSLVVVRCHALSLAAIRCHWLYHSLSFAVYHSLSFAVIRCHSLYQTLSTVVTRCATRLSFYKRSPKTWNLRYFIEKNHEIWHVSSNMVLL